MKRLIDEMNFQMKETEKQKDIPPAYASSIEAEALKYLFLLIISDVISLLI